MWSSDLGKEEQKAYYGNTALVYKTEFSKKPRMNVGVKLNFLTRIVKTSISINGTIGWRH